jgi:hypothetical protein
LFLLYLSPRSFRPIPKRIFAGDDVVEQFRRILKENASPRRHGFPVIPAPERSTQ